MDRELLLRAIDLISSVSTLLIVLSTGVLALVMTLYRWFVPQPTRRAYRFLGAATFVLVASILFGVFTQLTLAGNLATAGGGGSDHVGVAPDAESPPEGPALRTISIYEPNVQLPFYLQLASFIFGLGVLLGFVLRREPVS